MGENEEPMALLGAIGGTEGIMWGNSAEYDGPMALLGGRCGLQTT